MSDRCSSSKQDNTSDRVDLGVRLSWKLLNSWGAKLSDEDILSVVGLSICETNKTFNPKYGVQFQTLLYYHLKGRLLKEISDIVKHKRVLESIDTATLAEQDALEEEVQEVSLQIENQSPEKILLDREEEGNFENALNNLDWLELIVVKRHCINEESLLDLSKELNYCRCHLSRVKTKALKKLRLLLNTYFAPDISSKKNADSVRMAYSGGRGRRVKV